MEKSFPGIRTVIREAFTRQETPEESIDIVIGSLSKSSLKSYECSLKKWWKFCDKNSIDQYEPTVTQILSFLTNEFNNGLSHSSINATRSAISLIMKSNISQESRLKRFFKGVYGLRPSRPKYDHTWDPKIGP